MMTQKIQVPLKLMYFSILDLVYFLSSFFTQSKFKVNEDTKIIVIPGFLCSSSIFNPLSEILNSFELSIIPKLKRNTLGIVENAKIIDAYIKKSKRNDIILIAHSKAGLDAKYYLDYYESAKKVSKLITISTTWNQTYADLFRQNALYSFGPSKLLVNKISKNKASISKVSCLFGEFDSILLPKKSRYLEKASNKKVPNSGHFTILKSKSFLTQIQNIIKENA